MKAVTPHGGDDVVTLDVCRDRLPRRPHAVCVAAVEVLVGQIERATDDVQDVRAGIGSLLEMHGDDVEPGERFVLDWMRRGSEYCVDLVGGAPRRSRGKF